MKQFFTLLILASLLGGNYSFAQSSDGNKIKYGIKAGINLASLSVGSERKKEMKDYYDNGWKNKSVISFHLGGYADYAITEALSIQAGLTLSGKGGKETWSYDDEIFGDEEFTGKAYDKENLLYLELPVNVVYKTGSFYFGAGPYVGYALSGKWKEWYEEDYGDGDIESDSESGKIVFGGENAWMKRTDFGLNFLAGYQLNEKMSIGIGYGLGLSNLLKDPDDPQAGDNYWGQKNRVFSISVNYILK